jgi:hypothetical protein
VALSLVLWSRCWCVRVRVDLVLLAVPNLFLGSNAHPDLICAHDFPIMLASKPVSLIVWESFLYCNKCFYVASYKYFICMFSMQIYVVKFEKSYQTGESLYLCFTWWIELVFKYWRAWGHMPLRVKKLCLNCGIPLYPTDRMHDVFEGATHENHVRMM